MTQADSDEPQQAHMGLPLHNGKLAIWLLPCPEQSGFFTSLIGVYLILRNGHALALRRVSLTGRRTTCISSSGSAPSTTSC